MSLLYCALKILDPLTFRAEQKAIEYLNDPDISEEIRAWIQYISDIHGVIKSLGSVGRSVRLEIVYFIVKANIDAYSTGLEFLVWSTKNPTKKFNLTDQPKEVRDLFVKTIGFRLARGH